MLELRLEGGKGVFFRPVPPVFGHGVTLCPPEAKPGALLAANWREGIKGFWEAWPIDDQTSRNWLTHNPILRNPVEISERTPGVALLAGPHEFDTGFHVQLLLSTKMNAESGVSVFKDWLEILSANKDDLNRELVLTVNLGALADEDIAWFCPGHAVSCTDITLQARPRMIQFTTDDR